MDVANIRIHNSQEHPFQVSPFEEAQVFETGEDFSLQNGYIRAHFNKDGFLQDITTLDDKVKTEMKLEFIKVWNLKKAMYMMPIFTIKGPIKTINMIILMLLF